MAGHPQLGTNPWLSLDCTAFTVVDNQGASSFVIAQSPLVPGSTSIFTLGVTITFAGALAPWIMSLAVPFTVNFYAESLTGAGGGVLIGSPNASGAPTGAIQLTTATGTLVYNATAYVDANNLSAPGTYKLTALVSFSSAGSPPPPMSAFQEGPVIEIYP